MISFPEDTDFARLIQARMASYSTSLLDMGKSSHMACSILSSVWGLKLQADFSSRLERSAIHIKDPPAIII